MRRPERRNWSKFERAALDSAAEQLRATERLLLDPLLAPVSPRSVLAGVWDVFHRIYPPRPVNRWFVLARGTSTPVKSKFAPDRPTAVGAEARPGVPREDANPSDLPDPQPTVELAPVVPLLPSLAADTTTSADSSPTAPRSCGLDASLPTAVAVPPLEPHDAKPPQRPELVLPAAYACWNEAVTTQLVDADARATVYLMVTPEILAKIAPPCIGVPADDPTAAEEAFIKAVREMYGQCLAPWRSPECLADEVGGLFAVGFGRRIGLRQSAPGAVA